MVGGEEKYCCKSCCSIPTVATRPRCFQHEAGQYAASSGKQLDGPGRRGCKCSRKLFMWLCPVCFFLLSRFAKTGPFPYVGASNASSGVLFEPSRDGFAVISTERREPSPPPRFAAVAVAGSRSLWSVKVLTMSVS